MRNYGGGYGHEYRGSSMNYDRELGPRGGQGRYGAGPRGGWSGGYSDEGLGGGGGYGGGRDRERMSFRPRHEREYEYDRDMGDEIREGWQDLKRGVRRAFGGGGYDRGYRDDLGRGSETGYGNRGAAPWRGGGNRGFHGPRFGEGYGARGPRYGADYWW